jgi:hypothetical protein
LRREWEQVKANIEHYLSDASQRNLNSEQRAAHLKELLMPFHERLCSIRVLDPACGSANFLYVSLAYLKALKKPTSLLPS